MRGFAYLEDKKYVGTYVLPKVLGMMELLAGGVIKKEYFFPSCCYDM